MNQPSHGHEPQALKEVMNVVMRFMSEVRYMSCCMNHAGMLMRQVFLCLTYCNFKEDKMYQVEFLGLIRTSVIYSDLNFKSLVGS